MRGGPNASGRWKKLPALEMAERTSIVVLTCNRVPELCRTLGHLVKLPGPPPIIVVDNGSRDGTAVIVRRRFPQVALVTADANLGAAGRNAGVAKVTTPYVAFCDDDTWWRPGALECAADLLDRHPGVAAIAARVLVGPGRRTDPTCLRMARSPLASEGLPGRRLAAFMAGAVVMRTDAYRAVGGYEPRFFLGAEEYLMALDLMSRGWHIVYCPEVVNFHQPSRLRDRKRRAKHLLRNRLWITWMRLPLPVACEESLRLVAEARGAAPVLRALREFATGLPWALSRRQVIESPVLLDWRRAFREMPALGPADAAGDTLPQPGQAPP